MSTVYPGEILHLRRNIRNIQLGGINLIMLGNMRRFLIYLKVFLASLLREIEILKSTNTF